MNSEPPPLASQHEAAALFPLTSPQRVAFVYGCAMSLAVLFSYNIGSYVHLKLTIQAWPEDPTLQYGVNCGFPFAYYYYYRSGWVVIKWFWWSGIVGDVLFALLFSAFIGWLCAQLNTRWRAHL